MDDGKIRAVYYGDTYHENIVCPACSHEMEVETNDNNFITYDGKTSDEWDDLKCPKCGQELIVGIISTVLFHTKIKVE